MKITPENRKLIIGGGIAIGSYFLIIRPILQKIGILKTKDEKEKERSDEQNVLDLEKNTNARGLTLSKSKAEWDQIADTIYNELYTFATDNKDDAAYQLARLKNDADAVYLVKTFGQRKEKFFGFGYGPEQALIPFVNANLSRKVLNLINDNYKRKGMTFKL